MYQPQNKTQATKSKTPFCKVCFDAKKPESMYTSHFVKSAPGPNGTIVCPTLLNQSCRKCGQLGHTSGYCGSSSQSQSQPQYQYQSQSQYQSKSQSIGAEAELRLIASTFKSKHQEFPEFPLLASLASLAVHVPEEPEEPEHVYNPKSNPFGALSQKQKRNQSTKSTQPTQSTQSKPAKPMTMAERLKNPQVKVEIEITAAPKSVPNKPKFADLPPKSQFWWQDED